MELVIEGATRIRTNQPDKLAFEVPGAFIPQYTQLLAKEKPGAVYRVTLDNTKRRSTGRGSQCNHFHGHCQQIAQATSGGMASVKAGLKWRAADDRGYPLVTILGGRQEPKPESECNTFESFLLIETAHQVAAELGIALIEAPYSEGWDKMRAECGRIAQEGMFSGEEQP